MKNYKLKNLKTLSPVYLIRTLFFKNGTLSESYGSKDTTRNKFHLLENNFIASLFLTSLITPKIDRRLLLIVFFFFTSVTMFGQQSNITISTSATSGGSFTGTAPNRVFTVSASSANIQATALATELLTNNVTINTAFVGGTGNGNVTFNTAVTVASTGTTQKTFTINASGSITVSNAINLTPSNTGGSNNTARPGTNVSFTAGTLISVAAAITTTGNQRGGVNGGDAGSISLVAGTTIAITGGALTANGVASGNSNGGDISLTGPQGITITQNLSATANGTGTRGDFTINDGSSTVTTGGGVNDGQTAGVINGGTFTKSGSGTFVMSGSNTYTGITTVSTGVLKIKNATATGTTAGGVIVSSGAALQVEGGITVGAEALTLNGTGISNDGALRSVGTGNLINTWGGTITLGSTARINADASSTLSIGNITGSNINLFLGGIGTINVTGAITTGTGSVTDDGPGNIIFSGTNTYSGATNINNGITNLGASNVFANNSNLVLNGGTFKTGTSTGFSDTMGTLTLSSNSTFAFGSTSHTMAFTASNAVTWAGTLLTIDNWTGTGGSTGTAGKITVGTTSSGLTSGQLAKFRFTGYAPGAVQLSNGEVVPTPAPVITSATTASSTYGTASSYTIIGSNTPTSYNATGLPTGMSVNTTTGVITVAAITAAGNYSISISATNASGTSTITTLSYTVNTATPTVTVTVGTYTFSGSPQGPTVATNTGTGTSYTFSYSGTPNTGTFTTGATRPTNAGTYTVTATVAANGNYGSASSSATAFTIGKATPVVTITGNATPYTYSGSTQGPTTSTNTGTGVVTYSYSGTPNTGTFTTGTTLPTNAGTYSVTATAAASVDGNWNAASSSASAFTIGVATPTVTVTVGTYTYSGSPQGPTVATNTGTGTSYTFSYSGTDGTTYGPSATLPTNAGSYSATATVAANGNYNLASSVITSFTIEMAELTITASDVTKDFGTTYNLGTTAFSTSGLLNSETIGGVTLTSEGADSTAEEGTYPIIPSAATGGTFTATNYNITYSNGTLIVNEGSEGGIISANSSSICSGTTTTLNLSGNIGNVIRWEYAISPFTNWIVIANTNSSYTTPSLTETTQYRAVVRNGNSPERISTTFEVSIGGSTTWDGSAWNNGEPDSSKTAIISGTYTSNGDNINACSLTINNNATVVISAGDNVTLSGALTTTTGTSVTFQSNAHLIQNGTTNTNSGSVTFQRESALIKRLDYTFWSSPVAGQQLQAFSPQTLSNRFYTYNSANNAYDQIASPSATNFEATKGYLIRAANNLSTTVLGNWLGQFRGIPNNGNYTFTLSGTTPGNRFNLVGNPYPSPISVVDFIENANNAESITGTLYFLRKVNGSLYPSYCTLTPLGGFVSNGHPSSNAFAQNPNAVIETGQGFLVEATGNGSGTVEFNNTMRTNTHHDRFLKTTSIERNRLWLNLTNANGAFSQTMVGYITNATQDFDNNIDGKYNNDGDIAIASLIGTTPYAIQGRALPFDPSDVVKMSFKTATSGNFTIAIDHTDGFFAQGQIVYLKDNLTGTVHNLNSGGFTFTSEAGTFDSRFELLYQLPLATTNPQFNANQVIIYKDAGNNLIINTGNESMAAVKVFDINGKLILEKKGINAAQTSLFIGLSNEVVLIQITSESGIMVTKKYLLQRMTLKKDKPAIEKTQIANDD
jgi:hypothetical protein